MRVRCSYCGTLLLVPSVKGITNNRSFKSDEIVAGKGRARKEEPVRRKADEAKGGTSVESDRGKDRQR